MYRCHTRSGAHSSKGDLISINFNSARVATHHGPVDRLGLHRTESPWTFGFSVGPVAPSPGKGWIEHPFSIENVGTRRVVLSDLATSVFLGPPARSLIAADPGCGYGFDSPTSPVTVGNCLDLLEYHLLKPGKSVSFDISLLKELRGMTHLATGTYVFHQPVGYRFAGSLSPAIHTLTVRVTYTLAPS